MARLVSIWHRVMEMERVRQWGVQGMKVVYVPFSFSRCKYTNNDVEEDGGEVELLDVSAIPDDLKHL